MPEQEQPPQQPQPTYPATNIVPLPDGSGVQIITAISPTAGFYQIIPESAMNAVCGKWLESRKDIKHELQLIQDIKEGRDVKKLLAKGMH